MISRISGLPDTVIGLTVEGRITRHDFTAVLLPEVEQALRRHHRVRFYCEVGPDFAGIDGGAHGRTCAWVSATSPAGSASPW